MYGSYGGLVAEQLSRHRQGVSRRTSSLSLLAEKPVTGKLWSWVKGGGCRVISLEGVVEGDFATGVLVQVPNTVA